MSADGTWKITVQTPMGAQSSTVELASDDGNRTSGKIVHHMSGWTPAIKSIAADPVADPGQPLLAPLDTSV